MNVNELSLRDIRKERKFTQKQIAEFLGVSVRTIQNWEHGRTKEPAYIKRLVSILEIVD